MLGRGATLRYMFDRIVDKYDLVNKVITLGLDSAWRKACARECGSSSLVVDLGCGSGFLSKEVAKAAPSAFVVGVDFSKAMLSKAKANLGPYLRRVDLVLADAAHLPFREGCFDAVATSFSLRNLLYEGPGGCECLGEVLRVLKARGRFVSMETSQPKHPLLRALYHLYLKVAVPLLGWLISKDKGAYGYLGASAINFPPAEEIKDVLLRVGFRKVFFKHFTLGAVALHVGIK